MRSAVRATAAALAVSALLTACVSSQASDGPADGQAVGPGATVATETAVGGLQEAEERGWRGTFVSDGYPIPAATFTDTHRRTVTLATAADRPVTLIFFGYSHCPDICSIVLANIASALRGAPAAVRQDVRVMFVTTDPARDTPPVTRAYLDRFNAEFEGLIAPVDTVAAAAEALYLSYEEPDSRSGPTYKVEHATYTTGFLQGRAHVVWSADTSVAALRADLVRLAGLA